MTTPNKAQHTPGPWMTIFDHPDPEAAPAIGYIRAEADAGREGLEIATIYGCNKTSYAEEQRANARLIAAAPELLATLRQIQEVCEHRYLTTGSVEIRGLIDLAIAKAEGRAE